MKDGNVNDFLDHVTYEEEAVMYNGKKYFFHGLLINPDTGIYEFTIDLWEVLSVSMNRYVETVYQATATTADECMNRFLNDPIIDGRRFWDIEKEMEWIDW